MVMIDEALIEKWVGEGTVTGQQAQKMRADIVGRKQSRRSHQMIVAFSTLGSLLLGVGVILFVASNWQVLARPVKQLLLISGTFLALGVGYYLAYVRRNLPRVGASLIFLSALMFGGTLALLGQMYHVKANAPGLILTWLLGVVPLAYLLVMGPLTVLVTVLFLAWVALYAVDMGGVLGSTGTPELIPVLAVLVGAALYGFGIWHARLKRWLAMARTYRLIGLEVLLFGLFALSFSEISGTQVFSRFGDLGDVSTRMLILLIVFGVLSVVLLGLLLVGRRSKDVVERVGAGVGLGVVVFTALYVIAPSGTGGVYPLLFTLLLGGSALGLVWAGYHREDVRLVTMGFSWLGLLIIVRYFDWFWSLLDRSLFFMIGGVILVGGGIWLERKRRHLKSEFSHNYEQAR